MKKRLILDFDGTLVEFQQLKSLEELMTPGYFANLFVFENVISAIQDFHKQYPEVEIVIASKVLLDAPHIPGDKDKIIDKHLSFIKKENRIYIPYFDNKSDYFEITKEDYLLDDYTDNLIEFEEAGGHGIKLLNGINNTNGRWKGHRIHNDFPTVLIVDDLKKIIIEGENENEMEKN